MEEHVLYELMGLTPPAPEGEGVPAEAETEAETTAPEDHPLYPVLQLRRQTAEAQAKEWYAGQLRQIAELEPEVRTIEDLAQRYPDEFPQMLTAVRAGIPLAVAFKGLLFDTLAAKRTAAARRAGAVQAAGKEHLQPVGGGGKAAVAVPDAVRTMYRDLMPGITEREIQEAYGKYVKTV